jgi:hypothetical protein
MSEAYHSSHSTDVKAWLDCGAYGVVDLSRVTPRSVVARAEHQVPPCSAALVVSIDGREYRQPVQLVSGFRAGRRAARVLSVDDVAPF